MPSYKIQMVRCKVVRERTITLPKRMIDSAVTAAAVLHKLTDDVVGEKFVVMMLNARLEITGVEVIASGCVASTSFRAADVFRSAIVCNAMSIIVGHNHPSGDITPSKDDIETTKTIQAMGVQLGITLIDHIITVASGGHYSMLDAGVVTP